MPAPAALDLRGADGIRIVADRWGRPSDRCVVLLHGGGQNRHAWRATASELAARGWQAVALDLRGHGDSDWPGVYGFDGFAADLLAVLDDLPAPPAVIGASLGGMSALAAQATAEEQLFAAVVLVDVAPRMEPQGVRRIVAFMLANPEGFATLDEAADAIAAYLPHRRRPPTTVGLERTLHQGADGRWRWRWDPAFLAGSTDLASGDPGIVAAATKQMWETMSAAAARLAVPTLLVRGALSDVVGEDSVADLLTVVPHARSVDVSDAGHMVAGDRNDAFTDAVIDFLTGAYPPD